MPAEVASTASLPGLSPVAGKPIVARFDGGLLSSDGGCRSCASAAWGSAGPASGRPHHAGEERLDLGQVSWPSSIQATERCPFGLVVVLTTTGTMMAAAVGFVRGGRLGRWA
jgi:hypothetical protein